MQILLGEQEDQGILNSDLWKKKEAVRLRIKSFEQLIPSQLADKVYVGRLIEYKPNKDDHKGH